MRILNLYAGIGGNRTLWNDHDITAVENDSEIAKAYSDRFHQDEVIVGDAHQYLLKHFRNMISFGVLLLVLPMDNIVLMWE